MTKLKQTLHPREQYFLRMFSVNEILEDIINREDMWIRHFQEINRHYALTVPEKTSIKRHKEIIKEVRKFIKAYNKLDL